MASAHQPTPPIGCRGAMTAWSWRASSCFPERPNRARPGEFPLGNAVDVTAELDGVAVPVLVRPGGRSAAVAVAGADRRILQIRRSVVPQRDPAGATVNLPVNPVASARVEIENAPEGDRIEVPEARGQIGPAGEGVAGWLGPVDALAVRWRATHPTRPVVPATVIDGLLVWDAEPAGDRVRARLTYRNPEGTPRVRLGMSPGLVVRSSTIPGRVDASWRGSAERPEWVASVEPPLPDGTTIQLEFWRPASFATETGERSLPPDRAVGCPADLGPARVPPAAGLVGAAHSSAGIGTDHRGSIREGMGTLAG